MPDGVDQTNYSDSRIPENDRRVRGGPETTQLDPERRATALLADHADHATVRFHDRLRDRQAETGSSVAPGAIGLDLREAIEDPGEGVELIDEIEGIAPGDDPSLTVNLDAANYVIICNIPGHYKEGMHTTFVVS